MNAIESFIQRWWNSSMNTNHVLLSIDYSKYDLYSKADEYPDIDKLEPYYQQLIDEYVPGLISF